MMLQEEVAIPLADLPMSELRRHLRLGSGFGEDTLQDPVLESFLRAALSAVEARTGKCLIAREFSLVVRSWTAPQALRLPVAPVRSISSVSLVDADAVSIDIAASAWRLYEDTHAPELMARGTRLPSIPQRGHARITFEAGYGTWQDVPADLCQAVFLLTAHYYDNRHETHLGQGCMPFGVTSLLERYKMMRLSLGAIS